MRRLTIPSRGRPASLTVVIGFSPLVVFSTNTTLLEMPDDLICSGNERGDLHHVGGLYRQEGTRRSICFSAVSGKTL